MTLTDEDNKKPKDESAARSPAVTPDKQEAFCRALGRDFRNKLRKVKFLAEVATLIVLGIYTSINYCLYRTTVGSFHADQRPWVGVDKVSIPSADKRANGTYLLQGYVKIKNFGPRIARNVFTVTGGFPTDEPGGVCESVNRDCGSAWSFASGKGQQGWSAPSDAPEKHGVVLFPEQDRPEGIYGALEVKKKLPTEIFLPGCIVYFDQFGDPHHTRFCFNADFDGTNFRDWYQCQICNDAN